MNHLLNSSIMRFQLINCVPMINEHYNFIKQLALSHKLSEYFFFLYTYINNMRTYNTI